MIAVIITAMWPTPGGYSVLVANNTLFSSQTKLCVLVCACECVCTCVITFASVYVRTRTALCANLSSDSSAVRRLGKNYPCVLVRLMYAKISKHAAQLLRSFFIIRIFVIRILRPWIAQDSQTCRMCLEETDTLAACYIAKNTERRNLKFLNCKSRESCILLLENKKPREPGLQKQNSYYKK